jgi:hypothetical protein
VSEHARYRQRLIRLGADELAATVARVIGERGWTEPGTEARRTYGRFEPARSPWATLLYALGRTYVEVAAYDPGAGALPADVVVDDAGPLRFTKVEDDAGAASPGAFLRAHPDAVIIRYRPGRRCVLRVGDRFVKLVRPELGIHLHATGTRLWDARRAGRLPFRVAEPDHWDAEANALWQGVVAGEPIGPALNTAQAEAVAQHVGMALGALAAARVEPWQRSSGAEQWARTERAAAEVVRRVPELRDDLADVLARLRGLYDGFVPRPPVPAHGAASPDQWLDDGSTLGLVDFDRFSWGDPEQDAAAFLGVHDFDSELRRSLVGIEAALRAGFREAGFALDERRSATYRVGARLRKVARTAMAVRPDGDERASRHLGAVVEALEMAEQTVGQSAARGPGRLS